MQERTLSSIVKSLLVPKNAAKSDTLYSSTINLMESNISVMDFNNNKAVFELFSQQPLQYVNLS